MLCDIIVTNKVASASCSAADTLQNHVDEGRAAANEIINWFTERGFDFALNVVVAVLMLVVGYFLIKFITLGAAKAFTRGGKKKTLFSDFASSVVSKGCWAILIVMVLSRLGVNVGPLIAGLGVTGFILGFAFQESLGNLASGMMIALNEPFKTGDFVEIAGFSGSVIEVNMMATVLATPDNKKIVVPNKSAWGGPITNYSALDKRRVDLTVGIAYGENIAKAVEVAKNAVLAIPEVLTEPAIRVAPSSFDDSQVTLVVRPWVKTKDYWHVHAEAIKAVKTAFDKEGIQIPFPQLDVHQV